MKKKILLSSIVTIGLCLCMIAGSTFALFTSESELNVAVTSGTVSVEAKISETSLKLSSIRGVKEGESNTFAEAFGEKFYYVVDEGLSAFHNGGTAKVDDATGKLEITNLTPGDKITFQIATSNTSTVNINTRIVLKEATGSEAFAKALKVHVNDVGVSLADDGFTSAWKFVEAKGEIGTYTITIELPASVENYDLDGNLLQGQSISFDVILQAVQANEAP